MEFRMMTYGPGKERTEAEYRELLTASGFGKVTATILGNIWHDAIIAYKDQVGGWRLCYKHIEIYKF